MVILVCVQYITIYMTQVLLYIPCKVMKGHVKANFCVFLCVFIVVFFIGLGFFQPFSLSSVHILYSM